MGVAPPSPSDGRSISHIRSGVGDQPPPRCLQRLTVGRRPSRPVHNPRLVTAIRAAKRILFSLCGQVHSIQSLTAHSDFWLLTSSTPISRRDIKGEALG